MLKKLALVVVVVLLITQSPWFKTTHIGIVTKPSARLPHGQAGIGISSNLNPVSYSTSSLTDLDYRWLTETIKDEKLRESFIILKGSETGGEIAETIQKRGIRIIFSKPRIAFAAAEYRSAIPFIKSGTIVISNGYREAPTTVLAAIIAHEGRHAQLDSFFEDDSISQEYQCYQAQAKVWLEVRRGLKFRVGDKLVEISETNPDCDYAVSLMKKNKFEAFELIRKDFQRIGIDLSHN
ncbi:MAG: hypothetical protein QMD66_02725 [Actinomycetota bacterium]|nr:hypothetical protein [Actinomycetota bacterium]